MSHGLDDAVQTNHSSTESQNAPGRCKSHAQTRQRMERSIGSTYRMPNRAAGFPLNLIEEFDGLTCRVMFRPVARDEFLAGICFPAHEVACTAKVVRVSEHPVNTQRFWCFH